MTVGSIWHGDPGAPVIVLVHGLGGSHRTWDAVLEPLSGHHRVAAVDLHGGHSIEQEAADLHLLLEKAGVVRATFAGHSMGGLVITALAERSPELVQRLILVNTPPTVESRLTTRKGLERLIRLPVIGRLLWSRRSPERRRAGLRSAVAPEALIPEEAVADLGRTSHQAFVGSTTAIDRYLQALPLAERLAALQVPVDVVFGQQDQRVDPGSLAVYDAVPRARVTTIDDAGHSPPWESPQVVTEVITGRPSSLPPGEARSV